MGTDLARRARYWVKVDVKGDDECWPWLAFRNPCGYGMFRAADGTRLAHRWAYQEFVRRLSPDEHVCHTCDNPACQNPRHWFIGSPADNSADKVAKGRQSHASQPGERNPGAKLTSAQVEAIRTAYAAGRTQSALSAEYGISRGAISKVIRAQRWGGKPQDGSRRRAQGTATANAKLDPAAVASIRSRYASGEITQAALAKEFEVSQPVISDVVGGRTWRPVLDK